MNSRLLHKEESSIITEKAEFQRYYVIGRVTALLLTIGLTACASGIITTDSIGAAAGFVYPMSVATDSMGNVYVADTSNNTIRKITSSGVVSTLAGSAFKEGSNDGTGAAARFNSPKGVATDNMGNVYVTDHYNYTIRKITSSGIVSTFAGYAGKRGSEDGNGATARFLRPNGVAIDSLGNVYVTDSGNHTIRKITPSGVVSTLAGLAGSKGNTDGNGSAARFHAPQGVATDKLGNIYVADGFNNTIRKITSSGVVSTFAGSAGKEGSNDGIGAAARFYFPRSVAIDSLGNIYVAEVFNNTIRKISPVGVVSTLAGSVGIKGNTDGNGVDALFRGPEGVAVDNAGNIYVADTHNRIIRKITPAGVVNTLAGTKVQPIIRYPYFDYLLP